MEKILVLNLGGQYDRLIARRVREIRVCSEILPYSTPIDEIKAENYKGIILIGDDCDSSVHSVSEEIFQLGIPVLAVGAACEMVASIFDGKVQAGVKEFGKQDLTVDMTSRLFKEVSIKSACWMNHTNYIKQVPRGFRISAKTDLCPIAAMECEVKKIYCLQFHPEILHTREGGRIIKNFVGGICGCEGSWTMADFLQSTVSALREKIGDKKVLCALSGNINSTVAAVMLSKVVGNNLTAIFIDHGFLRKNEARHVESLFKEEFNINLITVDARERFLGKLVGVEEPSLKKKVLNTEFMRVFEEEAARLGGTDYLLVGASYPDLIDNEGVLFEGADLGEVLSPFAHLFNEEVRKIGAALGIPEKLITHQVFPNTGLALRILGKITKEKIAIIQEADSIFEEEIESAGFNRLIARYFAVLADASVANDGAVVVLRAVNTSDFMTADWTRLPYEMIDKVSRRIVNEVKGVSRVVYDVTSNPHATVEWE